MHHHRNAMLLTGAALMLYVFRSHDG